MNVLLWVAEKMHLPVVVVVVVVVVVRQKRSSPTQFLSSEAHAGLHLPLPRIPLMKQPLQHHWSFSFAQWVKA